MFGLDAKALLLSPGADRFVQAYTTQTPDASRGAFLDAKGRAVAVYDRVRLNEDASVFVVATPVVERLKRHLKNYLFLMDATLTDLPHAVCWDPEGGTGPSRPGAAQGVDDDWTVYRRAGVLRILRRAPDSVAGDAEFTLFRVRNHIPIQGRDYDDPMLLNLNDPELVSFNKGCYLGQEIMARVHYKGRPPLRLTSIRESECPPELRDRMTSRVLDPELGEVRGFVFLPEGGGV